MCTDKNNEGLKTFAREAIKPRSNSKTDMITELYGIKEKHNLMNKNLSSKLEIYSNDWLAVSTAYTKKCIDIVTHYVHQMDQYSFKRYAPKNSRFMVHLPIPVIVISLLALLISKQLPLEQPNGHKKFWCLIHLLAFATDFGAQIWMNFLSGLVLYFSMGRHAFGNVQEQLFPFFYMYSAGLSILKITAFTKLHSVILPNSEEIHQFIMLSGGLLVVVFLRLYVADQLVMLKRKKNAIEAEAGTGSEVGKHILGNLKDCPHYMRILRKFRQLHSFTSICSLLTVGISVCHLLYLADKFCI